MPDFTNRELLRQFLAWLNDHPSIDPSGLDGDMVDEFLAEAPSASHGVPLHVAREANTRAYLRSRRRGPRRGK